MDNVFGRKIHSRNARLLSIKYFVIHYRVICKLRWPYCWMSPSTTAFQIEYNSATADVHQLMHITARSILSGRWHPTGHTKKDSSIISSVEIRLFYLYTESVYKWSRSLAIEHLFNLEMQLCTISLSSVEYVLPSTLFNVFLFQFQISLTLKITMILMVITRTWVFIFFL